MEIEQKLDQLAEFYAMRDNLDAQKRAALDEVIIPDEIIDIQRNAAEAIEYQQKAGEGIAKAALYRGRVSAETMEKARQVYADIEARKRKIADEFARKIEAAEKNIRELEQQIKADVKASGQSVKGKYFHAVYVKGRVSWNTDMLDGMIAFVPQCAKARKEGGPSVTLRKI